MPALSVALIEPPSGALEAGVTAVFEAAALLWLGYALVGLVPMWREDPVMRWALAFPALVTLALVLMLAHLATGGLVFGSATAVRLVVLAAAVALLARALVRRARRTSGPPGDRQALGLGVATSVLAVLAWFSPLLRSFPIATSGDVRLHSGWTGQLLNGESIPSSPLTGDVPNYYPWLYHALLAAVTHVTPGGHPVGALAPMQILQVAGVSAALYGVGYQLAGRWAGCATGLLGAAAGGWGFFLARGPELVVDPRTDGGEGATLYAGDLLRVRSYNASFANLAPPYPRDVAIALLIAFLLLLIRAARTGRLRDYAIASFLLGLVGLTQTDAFLVGLATALFAAMLASGRRLKTSGAALLPALLVFGLWAGPVAVSYFRLGGFVDTTVVTPVELPLWAILGSWGIVTPLAAIGIFWAMRARRDAAVKVVLALLGASAIVLVASAIVPALLGEGFETIGRQHRYWPLLCLALAIVGGLGAHGLGVLIRRRSRAAVWVACAAVVALALPSPLLASWALPTRVQISPDVTRALQGKHRSALAALASYGDGACAVAAPESWRTFSYTGFHLLRIGQPEVNPNAARIRWADIYEHIVPESQRVRDDELLASGRISAEEFRLIAARYGLDAVLIPAEAADAEAFRGLDGTPVRSKLGDAVLFGLDSC